MSDMTCEGFRGLLDRLLDGEATPEELAMMDAHAARCPECAALREAMLEDRAALADALADVPPMPADLHDAWMDAVREERTRARTGRHRRWIRWGSIAAAVLYLVGGTYLARNRLKIMVDPGEIRSAAPAMAKRPGFGFARATGIPVLTASPQPLTTAATTPAATPPEFTNSILSGADAGLAGAVPAEAAEPAAAAALNGAIPTAKAEAEPAQTLYAAAAAALAEAAEEAAGYDAAVGSAPAPAAEEAADCAPADAAEYAAEEAADYAPADAAEYAAEEIAEDAADWFMEDAAEEIAEEAAAEAAPAYSLNLGEWAADPTPAPTPVARPKNAKAAGHGVAEEAFSAEGVDERPAPVPGSDEETASAPSAPSEEPTPEPEGPGLPDVSAESKEKTAPGKDGDDAPKEGSFLRYLPLFAAINLPVFGLIALVVWLVRRHRRKNASGADAQ